MIEWLKATFFPPPVDLKHIAQSGGRIIDVRLPSEYQAGHITGSINMPLQILFDQCESLQKDQPIIVCCASGIRSTSGKRILKKKGFSHVYNGGGWRDLKRKIFN